MEISLLPQPKYKLFQTVFFFDRNEEKMIFVNCKMIIGIHATLLHNAVYTNIKDRTMTGVKYTYELEDYKGGNEESLFESKEELIKRTII